jgi:DNA gyrase inhibitor GyrI
MIRYIDVPYRDILYAGLNHECPQEWDPFIGWMSMQDLLNQAQYKLSLMTSNPLPTPVATCPNGPPVSRH